MIDHRRELQDRPTMTARPAGVRHDDSPGRSGVPLIEAAGVPAVADAICGPKALVDHADRAQAS